MNKLKTGSVLILGLAFTVALICAQRNPVHAQKENNLMRAKLDHSQSIVEGLALKDFGLIKSGAEELKKISFLDQWMKFEKNDADYRHFSESFRKATDLLMEAADSEDVQAAGMRYMLLTMNCINCHEHIRD